VSLGLPDLQFDANGCARLVIDNAPALNFERDARGAIHLYSVVGPLPPEGREAVFAQLLQGNLFGESTAGATLAIDQPRGEILLCRTVVCELTPAPAFAWLVDVFVDAAQDWHSRLSRAPEADKAAAPFTAAPMMGQFVRG
jgi:hypothetical protein